MSPVPTPSPPPPVALGPSNARGRMSFRELCSSLVGPTTPEGGSTTTPDYLQATRPSGSHAQGSPRRLAQLRRHQDGAVIRQRLLGLQAPGLQFEGSARDPDLGDLTEEEWMEAQMALMIAEEAEERDLAIAIEMSRRQAATEAVPITEDTNVEVRNADDPSNAVDHLPELLVKDQATAENDDGDITSVTHNPPAGDEVPSALTDEVLAPIQGSVSNAPPNHTLGPDSTMDRSAIVTENRVQTNDVDASSSGSASGQKASRPRPKRSASTSTECHVLDETAKRARMETFPSHDGTSGTSSARNPDLTPEEDALERDGFVFISRPASPSAAGERSGQDVQEDDFVFLDTTDVVDSRDRSPTASTPTLRAESEAVPGEDEEPLIISRNEQLDDDDYDDLYS